MLSSRSAHLFLVPAQHLFLLLLALPFGGTIPTRSLSSMWLLEANTLFPLLATWAPLTLPAHQASCSEFRVEPIAGASAETTGKEILLSLGLLEGSPEPGWTACPRPSSLDSSFR